MVNKLINNLAKFVILYPLLVWILPKKFISSSSFFTSKSSVCNPDLLNRYMILPSQFLKESERQLGFVVVYSVFFSIITPLAVIIDLRA